MSNSWVAPISFTATGKITAEPSDASVTLRALDLSLQQDAPLDDLHWTATVELHRVTSIGSGGGLTAFALRDANASTASPLTWRYGSSCTDLGLLARWTVVPGATVPLELPCRGVVTDRDSSGVHKGLGFFVTFQSGFTGTLMINAWYED
ncbi:hypothetical protein [Streptomyces anandii]|uniref:hypothetical protein n=1 Tax=Streptomyces anandii TaxID=285454 RepID=UPI0037AB65FA